MSPKRIAFLVALVTSLTVPLSLAQSGLYGTDTRPARGFMPTADHVRSPIDSIDPVTGKLNVQIPLGSLPRGRAGTGFDLDLVYDSHIYDIRPELQPGIPTLGNPNPPPREFERLEAHSNGGWSYNFTNYVVDLERHAECPSGDTERWRMRVGLPDGSRHVLHLKGFDNETVSTYSGDGFFDIRPDGSRIYCGTTSPIPVTKGTLTYYTADGSYLKVEFTPSGTSQDWSRMTWRLYFPDGRRVVFNGVDSTEPFGIIDLFDPNGNRIRIIKGCHDDPNVCNFPFKAIVDDAGRSIQLDEKVNGTATKKRDIVTAPGPGPDGAMVWAIDWKLVHIGGLQEGRRYQVTFSPPLGQQWQTDPLNFFMWVVEYVQLPVSPPEPFGNVPLAWNSYSFRYSDNADDGYGELDEVTTPSGAQYSYSYKFENLGPGTNGTAEEIAHNNALREKTITHDGVTDMRWTYTFGETTSIFKNENGTSAPWETKYTFNVKNNPNSWDSGLITRIEEPNGAVRKRIWAQNKTWGLRSASASNTSNNPYIQLETITDGTTAGLPSSKTSVMDIVIDKNGNRLTHTSYDWVPYAGLFTVENGSVIRRQTNTSYHANLPMAATLTNDPNAYWQPHNPAWWADPLSARRLDAKQRETISGNGVAIQAATEWAYDNPRTKGNVIEERRWDSVKSPGGPPPAGGFLPGNSQILKRSYDGYGNLTDIYEPEVRTHLSYPAQGSIPAGFLLGRVDSAYGSPEQRSLEYTWNGNGTAVTIQFDVQNSLSTSFSYDVIGRQTTATEAGLRRTETIYDDSAQKVTTKRDLFLLSDGKLQTITHYDNLDRVKLVQSSDGSPLTSDTDGIKVTYRYLESNEGGRVITSTPYRNTSETTLEWSCVQHDRLGRVVLQSMFNGGAAPTDCNSPTSRTGKTYTEYINDVIRMTEWADPNNIGRDYRRDALGRLIEVTEYASGGNYVTTYTYDSLDNLIDVVQGVQNRKFTYSSLSRLVAEKHPELGTSSLCPQQQTPMSLCYTYNENGKLQTRTDARNIVSTFTYDGLHRVRTKSYSDGTPTATYAYYLAFEGAPKVGQLKSVVSSAATTTYNNYTALGQVLSSTHTITGYNTNLHFSYEWFLNDSLKRITYPSNRSVEYQVDEAGRTRKVSSGAKTYADMTVTGANPYAADGRLARLRLANGLYDTREFNAPGSPTRYNLGTSPGGGERLTLEYNFHPTLNNGNPVSHVITHGGTWTRTQSFTYDSLNRLASASELSVPGSNGFSQTFGHDRYGNAWVSASSNLSTIDVFEPTVQTQFDAATNRLAPAFNYDAMGNQHGYGIYQFAYDAENRNFAVLSSNYGSMGISYDSDGRRVKKTWAPYGGVPLTTYYLYDALGQLAAEYSTAPRIAGTFYPFTDMLGSVRGITDSTGTLRECYDYLPYGRMLGTADNNRATVGCYPNMTQPLSSRLPQKFTGKERDTEPGLVTNLDYFGARYYSAAQMRFSSPDPFSPITDFDRDDEGQRQFQNYLANPQHWNRYAYALNNPSAFVDKDGQIPIPVIIAGAWAAYEIGSAFYDAYSVYKTFRNPNASRLERSVAVAGLGASAILPGGAYGAAGKRVAKEILETFGAQMHHIATNKNLLGGFTKQFEKIFDAAGISIDDGINKIILRNHAHKHHTPQYHQYVLDRLAGATRGLSPGTQQYRYAVTKTLEELRRELLDNPDMIAWTVF